MPLPKFLNISTILRLLLSIGILLLIARQVAFTEIFQRFEGLDQRYLILALCVFVVQYFLSTLKWKIILQAESVTAPFGALLRSYMIGNFISLFLPSSFGGDIYRVMTLRRFNADIYQNTSSVLFDRITGLFALASIAIISYSIFFSSVINYYFLTGYFAMLLGFVIFTADGLKAINFLKRWKLLRPLIRIAESFNRYRQNRPVLANALLIGFLFQNNIIIMNKLYCLALNINMPLMYLYVIVPLVYLTEAIPITINGLGLREGAFIFFFEKLGHTMEEAIALSMLVIVVRYTVPMVCGGGLAVFTVLRAKAT